MDDLLLRIFHLTVIFSDRWNHSLEGNQFINCEKIKN